MLREERQDSKLPEEDGSGQRKGGEVHRYPIALCNLSSGEIGHICGYWSTGHEVAHRPT